MFSQSFPIYFAFKLSLLLVRYSDLHIFLDYQYSQNNVLYFACHSSCVPPISYEFFSTLLLTSRACYLLLCSLSNFALTWLPHILFCLFKTKILIMVLCSVQFCVSWIVRLIIILFTSDFKNMDVRKKGNLIIETVEKFCFDSSILVLCCGFSFCFASQTEISVDLICGSFFFHRKLQRHL